MRLEMMDAKRIDPSIGKEFVHPCSFAWQKSRSLYIPFWIVNIDLFMGYIIITTQDHFREFCFQVTEIIKKFVKPCILYSLPLFAGCARRKIGIDQTQIIKIKLQYPPFFIAYVMSCTILNIVRFYFCKYCHPAITFFLRAEPVVQVSKSMKRLVIYVFALRFCFL